MIIENIKSVILFILVGLSLLLTLALWNYQPTYEELGQPTYLDETRLEGETLGIDDLVFPEQIYFHNYHEHSQMPSLQGMGQLFNQIKEWSFTSIQPYLSDEVDIWSRNMEVIFPEELPLETIEQVFNVSHPDSSWNQTYDRVYFQLATSNEDVRITFASSDFDSYLNAEIQSTRVYEEISRLIENENNIPLGSYEIQGGETIYLPVQPVEVPSYALLTEPIADVQPLINNLFNNPSMVRRQLASGFSGEESYYTDGSRSLTTKRVLQNELAMEFTNPLSNDAPSIMRNDLIRRSIGFTNDHSGWTDQFYLDEIDSNANEISYRMYYEGIPLFDRNEHTMITQNWRDNQIYQFTRPLFRTSTNFQSAEQEESVSSGLSAYQFFENNDGRYSTDDIEDMRIGFEVNTRNEAQNAMFLEPKWHIKSNGSWHPLSYYESTSQTRSGE